MVKQTILVPKITIGLDVSDRYCQLCVLDADGEVIEQARLGTSREALARRFAAMESVRVVLEVGPHSPWISRTLEGYGHEVIVANARQVALIYGNDNKGDRVDAESLARLGRLDPKLLRPITHRGEQAQHDLALLRARDAVVRSRTALVNHVRGSVKAVGGRIPKCSTESFPKKARPQIPEGLRPALAPTLEMIAELTHRIRDYDRQIEALAAQRYPVTGHLQQPNGVGALTALAYVLVLEDPTRFASSRAVGPYVGLRPKRDDSGDHAPELHITKTGDELLRRLLIQAAHYTLGPFGTDSDLRRWGLELAARGGKNAKKRATVAVARKLAVLLHHLWVTGEVYEPLRNAQRGARR